MAVVQIPNLPVAALGLNGSELLEIVQAGVSCRTTSQAIANLAPDMTFPGYWASYHNNGNQGNAGISATNKMAFPSSSGSYGISVVANTRLTVANTGVYSVQFIANIDKTNGGADLIDIWLMKNGANLNYTNARFYIPTSNAPTVASRGYIVDLNANDYLEIAWYSSDIDMYLYTEPASVGPSRPAIPSSTVNIQLVKEA